MTFPSWLKPPPLSTFLVDSLLIAGAFTIGTHFNACGTPAVVQTKDKVELHQKEQTVETKKTDTAKTQEKQVNKDIARDTTITRYPDGRIVTQKHVTDKSKSDTRAAEVRTVVQEKIKTVEVVRVETHEKTVTRRPDWTAGISAGVSLPALAGRPTTSLLPLPYSTVIGLSVERRILGSVYGGLNANSEGVVGVGLRVLW